MDSVVLTVELNDFKGIFSIWMILWFYFIVFLRGQVREVLYAKFLTETIHDCILQ